MHPYNYAIENPIGWLGSRLRHGLHILLLDMLPDHDIRYHHTHRRHIHISPHIVCHCLEDPCGSPWSFCETCLGIQGNVMFPEDSC